MMFAILAATRFAHFAAICLLFGMSAFPLYARCPMTLRSFRVVQLCGILALITGVLELLAAAGNMGDTWRSAFDPDVLGAAITETIFGRVWIGRLALAALIVVLCNKHRSRNWLRMIASGVLLASVALTGHSAIPGGAAGVAHRLADMIHLLAAGWWIGGLLALILAADGLGDRLTVVLGRFSRIGYAAVALLIASGVMKSIMLVSPISAMWNSAYGLVLSLKIALSGIVGLLALSNRLTITPALAAGVDQARWRHRLMVQIAAELAVAMVVIAVVGVLGAMSPPVSQ